jgi:hypothetical protein
MCAATERKRPRYEHDCRGCRFLGHVNDKDVYECDRIDLILRFGDNEQDNKAMVIPYVRNHLAARNEEWKAALALFDAYYGG